VQKTTLKPADFLKSLPDDSRRTISAIHETITKAIPKEKADMWEGVFWGGTDQKIIGYGDMVFVGSSKKEVLWFLVGVAQQKNYVTVFVNGYADGKSLLEKHGKELGKPSKVGKGAISFKTLEDIDLKKLAEVVKEAAKLRDSKPAKK
jgi:hypothetical protein